MRQPQRGPRALRAVPELFTRPALRRFALWSAALAGAYVALGQVGHAFAATPAGASLVWPPSGLALAAIVVGGYRYLPAVALGALFTILAAPGGPPALVAVPVVEAAAGALLLRRMAGPGFSLVRMQDVVTFAVCGPGIAGAIGAGTAAFILLASGIAGPQDLPDQLRAWWLGDAIGILMTAPFLIAIARPGPRAPSAGRPAEFAAVAAILVAAVAAYWWLVPAETAHDNALGFLVLPLVLWPAIRGGVREASAASLIVTAAAVLTVARRAGQPTGTPGLAGPDAFSLAIFVGVVALTSLVVAASIAERRLAEEESRTRAREQVAIARLGSHALADAGVDALMELIHDSVRDVLGLNHAALLEAVPGSGALRVRRWIGPDATGGPIESLAGGTGSQPGFALLVGEPVISGDLVTDLRFHTPGALRRTGIECSVSIPVAGPGGASAVLVTMAPGSREFTDADLSFLRSVANVLGAAMVRERADAQARFQGSLLDLVQAAVVMTDAGGGISLWNRHAEALLGLTREEALGRSPSEFIVAEAAPGDDGADGAAAAGDPARERWQGEIRFRRPDGSTFPALVSSIALTDDGGERGGMLAVAVDVTERKAAEEAMLEARRLESLRILAGGVAHDFNNILAAILGNAALAREDTPPDARIAGNLAAIENGARLAASLSGQLLTFAGRNRVHARPTTLNAAIVESGDLLRTAAGSHADLVVDLDPAPPCIVGDDSQLAQVLVNLVLNAGEAIGDGPGHITIATRHGDLDRAAIDRGFAGERLEPGDHAILVVSDTGPGLDGEARAHLFDPFYTTREFGRGLGLAAVLGIVQRHHGGMAVDSAPGRGTTFTIVLPVAAASREPGEAAAPATAGRPAEPPPETGTDGTASSPDVRPATILVVDDEDTVRHVAARILERAGFLVLQADGGGAAIDAYREHGASIDAVVLDLAMPDMSGADVYRALRDLRPEVRVVVMSGFDLAEAESRFGETPPHGFVAKPFAPGQLVEGVRAALAATGG